MTEDNTVTVTVGGQILDGWKEVRITRGVERLPSDFDVTMTEVSPSTMFALVARPGDAFVLKIGSDLVMTGYVDKVVPAISAGMHSVRLIGRSKCADLVDCSAEWDGGQISGASALVVAQKLAAVYGITATSSITDLPVIPQFNLFFGESAYEIIDRICRYSAALAYDLPDGNLYLARVGTTVAASGIAYGVNCQTAWVEASADGIYSDYAAMLQDMDVLGDQGDSGNQFSVTTDPNCRRHRLLYLICDTGIGGLDVLKQRAVWEAARRSGRSLVVRAQVDSWRDSSGALWSPNTLIPTDLPTLKVPSTNLLLGDVTFRLNDEGGHVADLTLMPPAAFDPQPVQLQAMPAEYANASTYQ